jgi:Leucine-rich repeat (LRR) protein
VTVHIWQMVDFSSRNLQIFDARQLLALRMKHLSLRSNSLVFIAEHAFDELADCLIELDLSINAIGNVLSTWLTSKLIRLTHVNLASNQISSFLQDNEDVQLSSLQMLNLSRNELEQLPVVIHRWASLTSLDLSFNQLSAIPRFALAGLHNLTWLSLEANRNLTCKSSL